MIAFPSLTCIYFMASLLFQDKHHNYTYNSNFGTLSVPRATDEEIELMQTVGRVSSLSKTGKSRTGSTIENRPPFIYPVPRRASEDHVHYKKPDDWRIAGGFLSIVGIP
eukprot:GEZU01006751.1.p1 GENE.GEZU01006751.1~~GEZU01006751.1.p1  ORF type:complete len:109 (-),score=12.14 GEZU01006751.1:10-336(-)